MERERENGPNIRTLKVYQTGRRINDTQTVTGRSTDAYPGVMQLMLDTTQCDWMLRSSCIQFGCLQYMHERQTIHETYIKLLATW
jgi:hypothetical protein